MSTNGVFRIFKDGEFVCESPNLITNTGRKFILDIWAGSGGVIPWMSNGSAYLVVGEGSGTSLARMGSLINELGTGSGARAQFINVTRGVDAGSQIIGSATFGGSGGRGNLWEIGVAVTGNDIGDTLQTASTTKNSGVLLARTQLDNQLLVTSGTVINVQYKYTLWDS